MKLADRLQNIQPFFVMDLLARARELEAQGRSIIHMEIGEPDFPSPLPVIEAGRQSLADEKTHYTPALGLPELREKLADYYQSEFNVTVSAQRIIITPGASGALQLALAVLVNAGDEVIMADPGYPCNRHMVRLFGGKAVSVPVSPESEYQLTPGHIETYCSEHTVAAMIASPSNPTGTLVTKEQMRALIESSRKHDVLLIVDEIYQGLVYDVENYTALSVSDEIVVINSFSKYFGMTGWRLGWMVVPEEMVDAIDRIAQNIFLAASTPAQYAALDAFSESSLKIMHARRDEFKQRRDYLLPELRKLGFKVLSEPQGAFYIYADCSHLSGDSFQLSNDLLEQAGVAVTPGKDFGSNKASQYLRFAYTQPVHVLALGVERLTQYIKENL
ncbi:MAG: pyridoxal phosphate-dependent aminotransferase [Gammaproteobacteria bacterium]|nr:pyridoxal phosphate-dependent aminotransferase [Gammaproteobacteria bacterium]